MGGYKAPFHTYLKIMSDKDNFCTFDVTTIWIKTTLQIILVSYKLYQIHNDN